MLTYVLRRLSLFVPSLLGASLLIFVLMRVVPGDIAEILVFQAGTEASEVQRKQVQQLRAELGLHRPILMQYVDWLGGAVRGDLGYSYTQRRPVFDILAERVPRSLELAVLTLLVAVVWAVPSGVVAATHQNRWADVVARLVSVCGLALPIFLSGVLMLFLLVGLFGWSPPIEFVSFSTSPTENLKQFVWPVLAQAFYIGAPISRLTRSQVLGVLGEDFVRTARAKGLGELIVVYRHAFANAILPVITFIGWWGGRLLGGLVIVETIFSVPGLGSTLMQAVQYRDYPLLQGVVAFMALAFLAITLTVDVLYARLDPRVRYT
ncbi:MAG: ABC transporter permease [Candidatus Rokubacteria bacterium]|nr:ABC transporter permease [Candidatus Rokubacteria bacterium]